MLRKGRHSSGLLAVTILLVSAASTATAQRVIAVSITMNAMREAQRVYLHAVDLAHGTVLPGVATLPGPVPLGRLAATEAGDRLLLSAGAPWRGGAFTDRHRDIWHATVRCSPFHMPPNWTTAQRDGWREWGAGILAAPALGTLYGVFPGVRMEGNLVFGRLGLRAMPSAPEAAWETAPSTLWDLPGRPVDAHALSDGRVAVLCARPDGGVALAFVQFGLSEITSVDLAFPEHAADILPVALAASPDGEHLWTLTRGFALDQDDGTAVSWVHAVDTAMQEAMGPPQRLRGVALGDASALHPLSDGRCWVALRIPGTDFASVSLLTLPATAGEAPPREREQALAGVLEGLRVAPDATGQTLAVALDRRIEFWRDGVRATEHVAFNAPLGALAWCEAGLLVGEAGQIHLVDPATRQIVRTVQLQQGWVTDLFVIPPTHHPADDPDGDGLGAAEEAARGTRPDNPDTDGDTLPDATDPAPLRKSACLNVTSHIVFHGEAAGRELRALRIDTGAIDASWRIEYDPAAMPWLVLYPRTGQGLGHAYLGVNPDHYPPGSAPHGEVTVRLGGRAAQESSHAEVRVPIRVAPGTGPLRRVLWACAEETTHLSQLRTLLAAPPHLFSHTVLGAPLTGDLSTYTVVVLDVRAAAAGVVARSRLLEFVREGGALLFLGAHVSDPGVRDVGRFLGPIGIYLDPRAPFAGLFAGSDTELGRHWGRFPIEGGCRLFAEPPYRAVPDPRDPAGAVLAARDYGHGRIAVLASPTPLGEPALRDDRHRQFAEQLFAWLADARTEFRDLDGDGLPDALEDSTSLAQGGRINAVDPGETDFLNSDSDGDGIPDGAEDANRNGRVDEGETDPRNPDSDGDGVNDGADPVPAAGVGAPHIDRVDPPAGPAEGGYWVTLSGRNLTPDSRVWFGGQRAPALRLTDAETLEVRVPDAGETTPGIVPVRVATGAGGADALLPGGFRYHARTRAELALVWQAPPRRNDTPFQGRMAARLDVPEGAAVRLVRFRLAATTLNTLAWQVAGVGASGPATGATRVALRTISDSLLEIMISAEHSGGMPSGAIALLDVRCTETSISGMDFGVEPGSARIVTTQGAVLDVALGPPIEALGGAFWARIQRQ